MRLLGRNIAALDTGNTFACIITPAFHGSDLNLRARKIVAQHLFLIEGIGGQLGKAVSVEACAMTVEARLASLAE
jgi:hypothetical protein